MAEIRARYATLGYASLTPEERIRLGLPPHMGPDPSKEHKSRKRKRPLGHFEVCEGRYCASACLYRGCHDVALYP